MRSSAILFGLLCILITSCSAPHVKISRTKPTSLVAEANESAPTTPKKFPRRTVPALFIVGDSTVHNAAPGLLGWGDVLYHYFDTNKIIIENHAKPGRSSRTFRSQGWWTNILAAAKPGDFVIIQMGHNDASPIADANRARGTLPGISDESTNIFNPLLNIPETVHTYGWYLRQYIREAKAKGITPIICSPVPRLPQNPVTSDTIDPVGYITWSREVAENENIPFIDLNHLVLMRYVGMSPPEIKTKFYTRQDGTHFSPAGAEQNARCVVEGLRSLTDCKLAPYLLYRP